MRAWQRLTPVTLCVAIVIVLSLLACDRSESHLSSLTNSEKNDSRPPNMVWIPGGDFLMGTDEQEAYADERPAHRVMVDGFWMDTTEVTNEQFQDFVEATGYLTTAERPIDWQQLKQQLPANAVKPPDEMLKPGSLVFTPPKNPVSLENPAAWWTWTPGANWRHPEGPGSDLTGRWDHPVVHVSWEDAVAYSSWAGKRLPSEAEWEFAARGGLVNKRYSWGDESKPGGRNMANTWQGRFPVQNTAKDGFARTAPIKSFPANAYGLYDIIGNVWEWCADWYRADAYSQLEGTGVSKNPVGPTKSWDPEAPYALRKVTKGGSFLCAENFCLNYRPSARRGTDLDTGMSHIGFRTVMTPAMWEKQGGMHHDTQAQL